MTSDEVAYTSSRATGRLSRKTGLPVDLKIRMEGGRERWVRRERDLRELGTRESWMKTAAWCKPSLQDAWSRAKDEVRTGVIMCLAAEVWPALGGLEAERARETAACFAQAVFGSTFDAPWLSQAHERACLQLSELRRSLEREGAAPAEVSATIEERRARMREEYTQRISESYVGEVDSVERTIEGSGCTLDRPWFTWLREATRVVSTDAATRVVSGEVRR